MASSGGGNAEEKNAGNADNVEANEGVSLHSRDYSVEYVGTIRKGLWRAILSSLPDEVLLRIIWAKICPSSFIKWDSSSSCSEICDIGKDGLERSCPIIQGEERLQNEGVSPSQGRKEIQMGEKLLSRPTDKKMELDEVVIQFYHTFSKAMVMGSSIMDRPKEMRDESRVVELEADKECSDAALLILEKEVVGLKKDKEDSDIAMEKLEKEVAEMKKREILTKKLVVYEFKAS
ncbi:hypothetical protein Acr_17g0007180 [Actinidia rufa]|uniref:Uncharacterized protein n=1 Tax=Actinidia rufa TaxID=165716 RepID=A0A7J0G2Y3_9ERIC|nr:hypothetical protein Acr_17g0007180 [Actinidia rufa]